MKRRGFLQRIGSILGTAGWINLAWSVLGGRYYQALATPPNRKLALLIGINKYPESPPLSGCLTDVELQRELLIHRFGFLSSDILTLTEEQASREFIEAAISEHLIKQVKNDDAVVFHFSGYGTRVQLEDLPGGANALIPVDETEDNNFANYLLEETLLLLLGLVPTDKVTAVLDTGYYPRTISQPSGLRFRSLVTPLTKRLNPQELNFLNHLLTGGLSINNGIVKGSSLNISNGVSSSQNRSLIIRASSQPDQSPGESLFYGFSAGLFTYALTQYLWEVIPPKTIHIVLSEINNYIYKLGNRQQPDLLTLTTKENSPLITENFPITVPGAQGVVTSIDPEGKTAQLWLGGLPPQVWLNYRVNSRFTAVGGEKLVFKSRSGLTAKAQVIAQDTTGNSLQVGQLVQETVRVLSGNINLMISLDSGLDRIERVDATSAFSALTRMVSITLPKGSADYIFGKLSDIPARYGLFSLGGELLENTAGEPGELVKVAVQRLTRKFSQLLAMKLWQLTENQGSSQLSVKVSLEVVNKNLFSQSVTISRHLVWERETSPASIQNGTNQKKVADQSAAVPTVPVNSIMVYRVVNFGDRPIYCMLVGLNNHKTSVAFYPWAISSPNVNDNKPELEQIVIAPGGSLQFPQNGQSFSWLLPKKSLFCEHQLIFSTSPFTKTLLALASSHSKSTDPQSISQLFNPLDVTQAILEDLHVASSVTPKSESSVSSTDSYVLDVNNWASLNFVFQSV
ncbi:caspase family protein [Cylindrospermopsis raciborskii]|uniref:Peptidase C14 n=1 Tax=Cylindrospermopsis raciborskii CENA302 TaxID=1170768 RepID=A0A9Q5QV16_9CYAN|nr:caspase family protein [Cylindrospermopsis raciborskii]NLQ05991.1 caspase family protein [Cylindrospermopsis raciborskii MVCC19]OHY32305.1 peptidase C14 [Cylindrospermopsis raciborskii MVCC14]OPH08779.1 peptidase C14 [Cylindrospermopsis raciborskii CENA302]